MEPGKARDAILKRTILKEIKSGSTLFEKPRPGTDSAHIKISGGIEGESERRTDLHMSVNTVIARTDADIAMSLHAGCNNIYADKARPEAVMISLTLPESAREMYLRNIMKILTAEAESIGVHVAGGHTEVSEAVSDAIVTVAALGFKSEADNVNIVPLNKNEDIVMSGYAGYYGAGAIASENEEMLKNIFSRQYINDIKKGICFMSIAKAAGIAVKAGIKVMHDIRTGGVFGALWELSEKCGCGLEADMRKLPIRQESIELCECFDVNPYMLMTMGAVLMVTDDGEGLAEKLREADVPAAVTGRLLHSNDKKITGLGEAVRYLDKPGGDELYRIRKLKEEGRICAGKY